MKPAVFDLFLAVGIGAYAVLWYFSIMVSGRSHSHNLVGGLGMVLIDCSNISLSLL